MGPCRGSWDWLSHLRRGEDERERNVPWRNGDSVEDDRPNGRSTDRRKAYQKPLDHGSTRCADDRGGGGSEGSMRSSRDWHLRGSPQDRTFSSYRSVEDSFYLKDRPPRPPYQRHETKPKRRDYGEFHRGLRLTETTNDPSRKSEDKRQSSPGRSRSRRMSRRHTAIEKPERENTSENDISRHGDHSEVLISFVNGTCCPGFHIYPVLSFSRITVQKRSLHLLKTTSRKKLLVVPKKP